MSKVAKRAVARRNIKSRLARRRKSAPTVVEPGIVVERMFVYVWEDLYTRGDVKFGEHFNKFASDIDARADVATYIRSSLTRQKYKFDEKQIVIHAVIDVTDIARRVGKLYPNAKMDDYIRREAALPGRIAIRDKKSEFHRVKHIDAFVAQIQSWCDRQGQTREVVTLSLAQIRQVEATLRAFDDGHRVILAELAPRFGKTIYAMAIARELNVPLIVFTSYVLTSFTSVINDINRFEQFANMVLVDTTEDGWEQQVTDALAADKQVVACVSLCKGAYREARFTFLAKQRVNRLWIVDEADYGAHQKKQASVLQKYTKKDRVILMTGSGGDRAVSSWGVDTYLSVTYPELLVNKRQPTPANIPKLKYFTHDRRRDEMYPNLVYLQLSFGPFVEKILKYCPNTKIEELVSMTKMTADPDMMTGFITTLFQALFHGVRVPQLAINRYIPNRRTPTVSIVFVSAATKIKNLQRLVEIVKGAIGTTCDVIGIHGEETTGRDAENMVRERLNAIKDAGNNRNLVIIAAQMAQRSFSVPEITETYLMYDAGDAAATLQKASRCLTPNGTDKIGYVISVSFDPNRDDKMDTQIDAAIENIATSSNISRASAAKVLFDNVEFWEAVNGQRVRVIASRYLEQLQSAPYRLGRVLGRLPKIESFPDEIRQSLLASSCKSATAPRQAVSLKGKTYVPVVGAVSSRTPSAKLDNQKIREAAYAIYEHVAVFFHGTLATTVDDMLTALKTNTTFQTEVESMVKVHWTTVHYLLNHPDVRKKLDWTLTVGR